MHSKGGGPGTGDTRVTWSWQTVRKMAMAERT